MTEQDVINQARRVSRLSQLVDWFQDHVMKDHPDLYKSLQGYRVAGYKAKWYYNHYNPKGDEYNNKLQTVVNKIREL